MALLSAWLEKRSTLGLWQRRFFLLEPDRLSYHSQRGELHSFPLHTITAVSRDGGEVAVAFAASSTTRELRVRPLKGEGIAAEQSAAFVDAVVRACHAGAQADVPGALEAALSSEQLQPAPPPPRAAPSPPPSSPPPMPSGRTLQLLAYETLLLHASEPRRRVSRAGAEEAALDVLRTRLGVTLRQHRALLPLLRPDAAANGARRPPRSRHAGGSCAPRLPRAARARRRRRRETRRRRRRRQPSSSAKSLC